MIGSLPLTTCNCGDIVAPHANFGTCELKWKLTKTFNSGNLLVVFPNDDGATCSCSPYWLLGSVQSRWPALPPGYNELYGSVSVAQIDSGEATWVTFSEIGVQTVSGVNGGKYYRPGSATSSGGVVIAQNLTCKFRIYQANPATAKTTLTSHGQISSVYDCSLCGTYNNCGFPPVTIAPGTIGVPLVVTQGLTGSTVYTYPSVFASPPPLRVRWLAATQRVVGLELTLTASGIALGEWLITKGPSGLTLSCATVTLVYPPTGKITPAGGVRAQIQATGYFTAIADSTVTTNAEVRDLQEMSEYLNGDADCVELVLVPLNSIAAPSSIFYDKLTPAPSERKYLGFDAGYDRDDDPVGACTPSGSCIKGWVFELNRGWSDDEVGFKAFIAASRGIRVDSTNLSLANPNPISTDFELQDPSPIIPLYRFDVRYKAPPFGATGWDYIGTSSSITNPASFSDPAGFTFNTTRSFSQCTSNPSNCCDFQTTNYYPYPAITAPATLTLEGSLKLNIT